EEIAARFGGPSESLWVVPPAGPIPRPGRDAATVRTALGVALDAPLVVSVARLHPQKDLATLIDAAAILRSEVPGVRVVIVGEGPIERELRNRIDERGLSDTVLLAGPSANAADELAAADVVVVTSLWESGPLVAAEALLLERPLVSTPVGFVPKLVEQGVSGWSTPVGDAGAVARSVAQALGDPVAAASMARIGRERVQGLLGAERLVTEVAAVYDRVLGRREASR
ncbi:MAG: glycosyltransferase, partial [Acidimicrobiales bacterium]